MAVSKSTTRSVETAIRVVSSELCKHAKKPNGRGSAATGYELRQTLLVLVKSLKSFEPTTKGGADHDDVIGFRVESEETDQDPDQGQDIEFEHDTDAPEARQQIGFRA